MRTWRRLMHPRGARWFAGIAVLSTTTSCHPTAKSSSVDRSRPVKPLVVSGNTQALLNKLGWPGLNDPQGYDDSQRVPDGPVGTGVAFSAMVAVFPDPNLGAYRPNDFNVPKLVAVVDLDQAFVHSQNPLNLQNGTNCLFLDFNGGVWHVQNVATSTPDCSANSVGTAPVGTTTLGGGSASDYPVSARIELGANGDTVGIGVQCAAHWCDLGRSSADVPGGGHALPASTQAAIEGWLDEQPLALNVNGTLQASPFWAVVVPEPGVGGLPKSAYKNPKTIAKIYVFGGTATAFDATKYGHHPAGGGASYGMSWTNNVNAPNQVQLQYDSATNTWTSFMIDGNNVTHKLQLAGPPMSHPGRPVPGTVRFIWDAADDDMWMPCGDQCCTVTAFM